MYIIIFKIEINIIKKRFLSMFKRIILDILMLFLFSNMVNSYECGHPNQGAPLKEFAKNMIVQKC